MRSLLYTCCGVACRPAGLPVLPCLNAPLIPLDSTMQAYGQVGNTSPDVRTSLVKAAYATTQELIKQCQISAGHDISDGGVAVTLFTPSGLAVRVVVKHAVPVHVACLLSLVGLYMHQGWRLLPNIKYSAGPAGAVCLAGNLCKHCRSCHQLPQGLAESCMHCQQPALGPNEEHCPLLPGYS